MAEAAFWPPAWIERGLNRKRHRYPEGVCDWVHARSMLREARPCAAAQRDILSVLCSPASSAMGFFVLRGLFFSAESRL
jgi:hypothetical protein